MPRLFQPVVRILRRKLRPSRPGPFPLAATLLAVCGLAAAQTPLEPPRLEEGAAAEGAENNRRLDLATLRRRIGHFDFEEAEQAPYVMPLNFHRHGALAEGYSPFGEMRLTDETAWSGNWSFGFELDGGSLAARTPTAVLLAVPMCDYQVDVMVRTQNLVHARARLVAWLHDVHGDVIPGSRSESPLINTEGRWEPAAIEVRGEFVDAADLVVQLEVIQPELYLPEADRAGGPLGEDVSGKVWFDELEIWHLPRINISTNSPTNVIVAPQTPVISVGLQDYTPEELWARLRVFDVDGRLVLEDEFPAPSLRVPRSNALSDLPYGWYRAEVDITVPVETTGHRWLDFAYMPPDDGAGNPSFGVNLVEAGLDQLATIVDLVRALGAGSAVLPLWTDSTPDDELLDRDPRIHSAVARLLDSGVEVTFAIETVPRSLARKLGIDRSQIFSVLSRRSTEWRPYLDELLLSFGLEVPRWQLGRSGSDDPLFAGGLDRAVAEAAAALSDFAPQPTIVVPMSAAQGSAALGPAAAGHLSVPYQLRPQGIDALAPTWTAGGAQPLVTFETAPHVLYAPRQRVTDLVLRTMHAWRAGLTHLAVNQPWTWRSARTPTIIPSPAFPVWRELGRRLDGRRFAGELSLGDGLHGWLLAGPGKPTALVVWSDHHTEQHPASVRMLLADGFIEVADVFGNTIEVAKEDGAHIVPVTATPRFIEGVDLKLARFRAGFAIDPPFLRSVHQRHEHEIVMTNPWDGPVAGTIRVVSQPQWQISPRVQSFTIPANGVVRLPISIVMERSVLAGDERLEAEIELSADSRYAFRVEAPLTVGLQEIELLRQWRARRNNEGGLNLVFSIYVTNRGTETLNLDAFLRGPNISEQRRSIGLLEPGESAIRTFEIQDGAALLAGETIHLGIDQRDGPARLVYRIRVPNL